MDLIRMNCWDFKNCGRQPGGYHAAELGVCPACETQATDGINNGEKGGRACWAVAGTLCGGKIQGDYAKKIDNCKNCNFYAIVHMEEKGQFVPTEEILEIIKEKSA